MIAIVTDKQQPFAHAVYHQPTILLATELNAIHAFSSKVVTRLFTQGHTCVNRMQGHTCVNRKTDSKTNVKNIVSANHWNQKILFGHFIRKLKLFKDTRVSFKSTQIDRVSSCKGPQLEKLIDCEASHRPNQPNCLLQSNISDSIKKHAT